MNNIKIFALYLPQYHTIPENDKWWGMGFTEWTNVKKSKPLFKGHNQPRIPLNNNYYNLLDDNTFKWQIGLAKKYGIDGFCFYHYWFNGKLLLEKPLENYLANKDLDFPFFFSWANEPWARTWDGQNKNVLMPQIYGGKDDIVNHFNYMLPFFKDFRYIKKDNKPVFVLYKANSITYLEEMIDIWTKMAKNNGFDGVFFIESLVGTQKEKYSQQTDACFYFEPMWSRIHFKDSLFLRLLRYCFWRNRSSYERGMKKILNYEHINENRYAGFFVDWDNSPRKGKNGSIYLKSSPIIFEKYLIEQVKKMQQNNCSVLFINAWNEWCEGAYLEPDVVNKYSYLECIKRVKNNLDIIN
ncbi:MAG: glycoside hydrolase family 99-like domain-containing protein [Bacteroidales bacterium]|nr:glycoside hydrolase family 99-like domain-containing protein [Bacteroidales bacterium]